MTKSKIVIHYQKGDADVIAGAQLMLDAGFDVHFIQPKNMEHVKTVTQVADAPAITTSQPPFEGGERFRAEHSRRGTRKSGYAHRKHDSTTANEKIIIALENGPRTVDALHKLLTDQGYATHTPTAALSKLRLEGKIRSDGRFIYKK